jgi:hypothetical protein
MKSGSVATMFACALAAGCALGPIPVSDPAAGPTAVLTVPYSVTLHAVDGRDAPVRFSRPAARSQDYILAAGDRELVVSFSVIWNDMAKDDHTPVRSRPATLSLRAEPGRRYRIVHDVWRTLDDARAVADNPGWRIVEGGGPAAPVAVKTSHVPAPVPAPAPAPAPPPAAADESPDAVRRMNEWWQHATPQEREAFLNGILPGSARE